MRRRNLAFSVLFFLLSLSGLSAAAQRDDFDFAESLYAEGDYFRAVTAYKRYLFLSPQGELAPEAYFKIADCNRRGKRIGEALETLALVKEKYTGLPAALKAEFLTGLILYDSGDNAGAAASFDLLLASAPENAFAVEGQFLKGFAELKKWDWDSAGRAFGDFAGRYPDSPFAARAAELAGKTKDLEKRLPYRSPALAGLLSAVLPGAGQLYSERLTDAMSSFFWNLMLGYLTWNAYDSETRREPELSKRNYGPAWTVGSIFGLFYLSNVYGAVNTARNANFLIRVNFTYSAISESGEQLSLILDRRF